MPDSGVTKLIVRHVALKKFLDLELECFEGRIPTELLIDRFEDRTAYARKATLDFDHGMQVDIEHTMIEFDESHDITDKKVLGRRCLYLQHNDKRRIEVEAVTIQ